MDSSLVILVGGTALFAGAVAYLGLLRDLGRRRAGWAAAGATAAVAVLFALMIYLAHLALPAVLGVVALSSGALAYLVLQRDLGRRRAVLAAVGAAAVVTASFLLVLYLAVIAFIGAVGVYLVARTRLRTAPALAFMGSTLGGLLAASVLVFWASLTYVM
ncbi:hypothetical protein [Plantactinospora sp. B5E13]|uniref:hypothetical protein n=1 Tax=Plantactinospora sp. B5E13 TaxID=3153758 RepID=UPI00325E9B0C